MIKKQKIKGDKKKKEGKRKGNRECIIFKKAKRMKRKKA